MTSTPSAALDPLTSSFTSGETARVRAAPRLPLLMRLAAWASRRRYGRVLVIIPYVYAWLPGLVLPHAGLLRLAGRVPLAPRLRRLVQVHTSQVNGCSFCGDLDAALAIEQGESPALLAALPEFRTSALFTPAEKAALAWVEETARSRGALAETLPELRAHFGDREIVALAWLTSFTTYLNTLAKSLGLASQGLCEVVAA
ncbi:MAG TPA: carboxymuconolactone decarboxylase family protein [Polyangiaceae bacterium]|jgi:AhpD family alkylhydroperoxidase|nr:carboxymuconolactone decarboxylase family protein [Polyangiaceae bacterium]